MRRIVAALVFVLLTAGAAIAQAPAIITDVRQAIAQNDFGRADQLLAAYRGKNGVTPEMLAALSWMGRGSLAAKQFDNAERYADETYKLSTALLAKRPLDQEAHLPIALGAAIEVLAQVDGQRGARTEAVAFLRSELATHKGTSIEKRIQKNINLLSLEGTPAPVVAATEYIGGSKPPALDSLKGKVVLMFFWAHWCGDCKVQGPVLADLAAKYKDQGLVVFAPTQRYGYVAGGKPAGAAEEKGYIEQVQQTSYATLKGQPMPLSEAYHMRYGVSTTPTLVLVDRGGIVRLYNPGKMTQDTLEPLVKKLLDSPAPTARD